MRTSEALCIESQFMRMAAYGRKQPFGLSLNRCLLTAALEKKADIRLNSPVPGSHISSVIRGDFT